MKIYKCDGCAEEFDAKDGMVDGLYTHERKIQITELEEYPKHGTINKIYKVRRTLKFLTLEGTQIGRDLCPRCVKLLEKP